VSGVADDNESQGLHSLTTEIVASFVGNNVVAIGDLAAVIASVFTTLRSVTQGEAEKPAEAPVPAVPIKKSIGTDYLICLEDGQKVKALKRHLVSRHHLTPDQYRQRWGLAKTYGLCGPALGLGQAARPGPKGCRGTLPCPRADTSSSPGTPSGSWAQEEDQLR
jgi:predicted transcriptional regulator